jgi:hypothetical protein
MGFEVSARAEGLKVWDLLAVDLLPVRGKACLPAAPWATSLGHICLFRGGIFNSFNGGRVQPC